MISTRFLSKIQTKKKTKNCYLVLAFLSRNISLPVQAVWSVHTAKRAFTVMNGRREVHVPVEISLKPHMCSGLLQLNACEKRI